MNPTHLHLLISHLPIFGSVLGALVLAYGLWKKNHQVNIAAYGIFIISATSAGVTYLTGEAAEETAENIQGITKDLIEKHEHFAVYALVSLVILGVASIVGLFLTLKKPAFTKVTAMVILFISLISFVLSARTGYLGGQIRHTEIHDKAVSPQSQGKKIITNNEISRNYISAGTQG